MFCLTCILSFFPICSFIINLLYFSSPLFCLRRQKFSFFLILQLQPWDLAQKLELVVRIPDHTLTSLCDLRASSYEGLKWALEFRSQCRILLFQKWCKKDRNSGAGPLCREARGALGPNISAPGPEAPRACLAMSLRPVCMHPTQHYTTLIALYLALHLCIPPFSLLSSPLVPAQ